MGSLLRNDASHGAQSELRRRTLIAAWIATAVAPASLLAQSPWERAAVNLAVTFTGPLARSLALVAIVIGGLMFMFGEAGAKTTDLRNRVWRWTRALRRPVPAPGCSEDAHSKVDEVGRCRTARRTESSTRRFIGR